MQQKERKMNSVEQGQRCSVDDCDLEKELRVPILASW